MVDGGKGYLFDDNNSSDIDDDSNSMTMTIPGGQSLWCPLSSAKERPGRESQY